MAKKRSEISKNDTWNTGAIYSSDTLWEEDYVLIKERMNDILPFKGTLSESAQALRSALDTYTDLERKLEKLYTYAHLKNDEDTKNQAYKSMYEKAYSLFISYDELSAFITPELLAIDEKVMEEFMNSRHLEEYGFYLEKKLRAKKHILSEKEERLMSMAQGPLSTASAAFKALNDADLKFGTFTDSENEEYEITHAMYLPLIMNKKREVREKAFNQYFKKYDDFSTTFSSLLYGQVKSHVFNARSRGYDSALDAALFPKNIETSVYRNLIQAARERISSLHTYIDYRKQQMKVDQLYLYDMYVPFVESEEIKMDYDQAMNGLFECVKPLGDEYGDILKKGFTEEGWVDKYENENKRSGAYSSGCYDTYPYILMNFNGTVSSARTLVHEAGHSMHSYFSSTNQPYIYGDYPIFLAEVASTFNEELFADYILKNTTDQKIKAYLLNTRIEEIRATFFRQTMFAEFELKIHELVEQDVPLTSGLLKEEYKKLNEFYFGPSVKIDDISRIEWARIPHFYYNFYVYQYATGISAAVALFKRVMSGGEKERDDYLGFLKSGSSRYPMETLKQAGVDMSSPEPVNALLDHFDLQLSQLKEING